MSIHFLNYTIKKVQLTILERLFSCIFFLWNVEAHHFITLKYNFLGKIINANHAKLDRKPVARYFSSCYNMRLKKVLYNLEISLWWVFQPQVINSTGRLWLLRHRDKKTLFSFFFLLSTVVATLFTLLYYFFLSQLSPRENSLVGSRAQQSLVLLPI